MELKYSTDEEIYNYDDLREAGEMAFDYVGAQVGDTATIYVGEPVKSSASDFMPSYIMDAMGEMAYEECGEHAADWPDYTAEQEKELVDAIKNVVDLWADKYGKHPSFYNIKNSRPITIELLHGDEYEEVLSA